MKKLETSDRRIMPSHDHFSVLSSKIVIDMWLIILVSWTTLTSVESFTPMNRCRNSYSNSVNTFRHYVSPDMVNKKPAEDSSSSSSFEQRMRKLALDGQNNHLKSSLSSKKNGRRQPIEKKKKKIGGDKPSYIHTVHTLQEYKREVGDEHDKIVVVRFYAEWCKACRAVAPFYYRLAKEFKNEIKFVEVPITDKNANIHQGLDVPSIPFGHIYHPSGGLVEELPLKRMDFPIFDKVLRSYCKGYCELIMDESCHTSDSAESIHPLFLNPYGKREN
mmetsp:Transcript_16492/g.23259  ORF Transcript_16492/g.23259 Transcript_16492/m.23259 type:complete len:275 (+) Transcript_16492:316-1140(+)